MTPAEIEAEARRLQDVWGEALATTGDHGAAGLAVAEASLRAREDMRELAAAEAEQRIIEYSEIDVLDKAPERERIARRIRRLPLVASTAGHGFDVRILSTAEIFAPMSTEDNIAADVAEKIHETSDRWPARADHDRLAEAHARIAALPPEKRHEAARRLSRSYSAPRTCVGHDGCQRDGDDIVWPDGDRWPTRTEGT